ncbi:MAG TPA: aromatic ring-hydroxylating dioxygenase subunit alpha [Myxococcales bacterium]|nr:aromatic ring-hydroxylating dioxygenase subunit alpha [Myxococcales bacterium]
MLDFLKDELAVFDSELPVEQAWTPPSSWYTQPEFMALEKNAVFDNNWIPIAHTEQLAKNGSYLATCIAGEPVAIVRESQSRIRALSNVCRHNAASILTGEGVTERLTCPYHGWQYDLSGALSKAPRMAGVRDFDRQQFQLPQLGLAEWGPLLLVRTKGSQKFEPFSGLNERLEQLEWRNLKHLKRRSYDVDCNWKVYIDNYLDGGYHVPILHPDLAQAVEISTYTTELFDGWSLQSVAADSSDRRMGQGAVYAWVYPNLMLNLYGDVMDTNIVLPLSNEKCRVIFDWYFAAPQCHDLAFVEKSLGESHQVEMEDEGICASVQRGLLSANYERGRYAPQVEHAKHHFHKRLHADLTAAL